MSNFHKLFIALLTSFLFANAFGAEPALRLGVGPFQPDQDKNDLTYRPLAS